MRGPALESSESDVYTRQILTYTYTNLTYVGPRTERVNF